MRRSQVAAETLGEEGVGTGGQTAVEVEAEGDGAAGAGEGGAGDGAAEGAAPPRRVAARARAVAAIERAIGPDNGAGQLGGLREAAAGLLRRVRSRLS